MAGRPNAIRRRWQKASRTCLDRGPAAPTKAPDAEHALSACSIANADKISPVSATSVLTLVQMVDADLGITYLPEMALGSTLLANTGIETRRLPGRPARDIGLAWRKGSNRSDEFRVLGDFIRKHRA